MNIALVGDAFTDEFIYGTIERIAQEGSLPVFDVVEREYRGGGVLNVASNLLGLGYTSTVFTITNMLIPGVEIVTPSHCIPLVKRRYVCNQQYKFRVDEPKVYYQPDLDKMEYPSFDDFDIIAFIDYDKGVIQKGIATIVDSKKKDLSVFTGSECLKINQKEWQSAMFKDFPKAFITKGSKGIDYYERGEFVTTATGLKVREIDAMGAGDTITAAIISCLAKGMKSPHAIIEFANQIASVVVQKFGTIAVELEKVR